MVGHAWIEATERVDFNTNRLPGGRRYANYGSVRSIEIKDTIILQMKLKDFLKLKISL